MNTSIQNTDPILLVGDSELIASTAACLLGAGHQLYVCTPDVGDFYALLHRYMQGREGDANDRLTVDSILTSHRTCKLVIAITHEDLALKQNLLRKLVDVVSDEAIIAINTESFVLDVLQTGLPWPERIVGLNWTEPVHTTFFLEIISGEGNEQAAQQLLSAGKLFWSKDAYIVKNHGIRSRMLSAMAREAFFLVEQGYATVADIDRACRNDAGYYLPFAGNCRYMDLMGTYAYGMVMKDLNPDLATDTKLPAFMEQIIHDGGQGMSNQKGFYNYTDEGFEDWKKLMDGFSYQIREVIAKYPFNYKH